MKNAITILLCLITPPFAIAQIAETHYKKADSLYQLKEFKSAASAYAAAIKMDGNNAELRRYKSAAASWSLAGLPDSAFHLLNSVAKSDRLSKFDLWQMEHGIDYAALRGINAGSRFWMIYGDRQIKTVTCRRNLCTAEKMEWDLQWYG